jgi:hypothetical protein
LTSLCLSYLHVTCIFKETSTKTATRRANAKVKDGQLLHFGHVCAYVHILLLAEGKGKKRAPSLYNLFVKEHMKTFLADNPGKTNKDAMKHVCPHHVSYRPCHSSTSRLAHFGKMRPRILSAVWRPRRRFPKPPSDQRKLQQMTLLPKVPRSSQAAMNKCLVGFMFLHVFGQSHSSVLGQITVHY